MPPPRRGDVEHGLHEGCAVEAVLEGRERAEKEVEAGLKEKAIFGVEGVEPSGSGEMPASCDSVANGYET